METLTAHTGLNRLTIPQKMEFIEAIVNRGHIKKSLTLSASMYIARRGGDLQPRMLAKYYGIERLPVNQICLDFAKTMLSNQELNNVITDALIEVSEYFNGHISSQIKNR